MKLTEENIQELTDSGHLTVIPNVNGSSDTAMFQMTPIEGTRSDKVCLTLASNNLFNYMLELRGNYYRSIDQTYIGANTCLICNKENVIDKFLGFFPIVLHQRETSTWNTIAKVFFVLDVNEDTDELIITDGTKIYSYSRMLRYISPRYLNFDQDRPIDIMVHKTLPEDVDYINNYFNQLKVEESIKWE